MKKKMKKILLIGILLGGILQGLSSCGKEQIIPEKNLNQSEIQDDGYEYPGKFVLGDNLKNAIIQIALTYDEFDENTVRDDSWKDIFVSHFLQNSMFSFDYLSELQSEGGGIIDAEEVSYIQKALTNQMIDFDNDVDTYQSSSYELTGNITDYSIEENADDSVALEADMEVSSGEGTNSSIYKVDVKLYRNEISCFDGYYIGELSKEPIESQIQNSEEQTYSFDGEIMEWEDDTTCILEFYYSNDDSDISYSHFVYLDLSEDDALRAAVVDMEIGTEVTVEFEKYIISDNYMYIVPKEVKS